MTDYYWKKLLREIKDLGICAWERSLGGVHARISVKHDSHFILSKRWTYSEALHIVIDEWENYVDSMVRHHTSGLDRYRILKIKLELFKQIQKIKEAK